MGQDFSIERLDIIDRIAEILFDLANSGVDAQVDRDELMDQLKTVGEIIIEGLGLEIVSASGPQMQVLLNNPA